MAFIDIVKGAEPFLPLIKEGIGAVGQYMGNVQGQNQQRNLMLQQQQALQGGRLGRLGAEDELTSQMNMINRVAPQLQTQITQQPTMTPFQNLMSNAALVGAIPGMAQQTMPGLLPMIGRQGAFGKGIQNLFGPDTSHVDEAMTEATRNFNERTVPGIMAMYGEGQDQAREYAIRQAGAEFMRNQSQMRVGAYERGLGRMDANTQNMLSMGMQRRFENVERPVDQPSQTVQDAKQVRAKADTLFGKYETRTNEKTGKQYKVGSQTFDKVYGKANDTQKKMIQRVLDRYPDKKSMPAVVKQFNTPEDYERFYQVTESPDRNVRELSQKIMQQGGSTAKRDLMVIAEAIKQGKQGAIDKIAVRRGLAKEKFQIDWKLVEGIAAPLAVAAGAALGSTTLAAAGGVGLIQSIFGKKQNPGVVRANATGSVGG